MKFWEKNLWIEPTISQSEQPKQAYSNHSIFSGAVGSIYFEPLLPEILSHFSKLMEAYQAKEEEE